MKVSRQWKRQTKQRQIVFGGLALILSLCLGVEAAQREKQMNATSIKHEGWQMKNTKLEQIERICASAKALFRPQELETRLQEAATRGVDQEQEPGHIQIIISLEDASRFQDQVQTLSNFSGMQVQNQDEQILDTETLVLEPEGFPCPYARGSVSLDHLEALLALDSVLSIEPDRPAQALDHEEQTHEQD